MCDYHLATLKQLIQFLSACLFSFALNACAGGYVAEEGYLPPDSPAEKAWLDEHTGNDENLGPNSPGYIGPDGEYSIYPDSDPH